MSPLTYKVRQSLALLLWLEEICISNKVIGCAANVNISADENIKFTATIDSDMIAGDDVNITASDVTTIVGTTKIDLNP